MINETKPAAVTRVNDADDTRKDFEYIVETITYVKLWVILFVLVLIKIILIKTVKFCKKVYTVHNDRIIRQHGATPTQA